jgi:hypothetical protein
MKSFSGSLGDQCIVYGSQNKILAYHHDSMDRPYVIAERPDHVTAIAPVDGVDGGLLDCGHYRTVNETLTGKQVGRKRKGSVFSVGGQDGRMVAVEAGQMGIHYIEKMFDVKSNETLYVFKGARGHTAYMAIGKDGIYYANEKVSRMEKRAGGRLARKMLTVYLGDHVPIASDANGDVFSLSYHNSGMNPKGTEVMDVNSGKMLACWSMEKIPDFPGYAEFFAFDGRNNIVAGAHNSKPKKDMKNLLYFDIASGTADESGLLICEPQILLGNAFEMARQYGRGNPITIIPFGQAEQFLRHAKKA